MPGKFPRRGIVSGLCLGLMATGALATAVPTQADAPDGSFRGVVTSMDGSSESASPSKTSLVVTPHPDDEFEMWSLIEGSTDNYKVFLVTTRGEQTGACRPETTADWLQEELGEVPPTPTPQGRWTTSCSDARMNSMLGFLTAMSEHDPSVPGDWSESRDIGPFPAEGVDVCRDDNGTQVCTAAQRTARVWLDQQGRGAVVSWDLGDGDLTAAEADWAIRTTLAERDALGLPVQDVHNALGGFSNTGQYDCHVYAHNDHRAVHVALWSGSYGIRYHAGATCADDPSMSREETVTAASADAAFEVGAGGERIGAFARHYGWLHLSYYRLDRSGQDQVFHTHQKFWIRRNG
ncbi:hypothetical protein [Myceligenerans pegani]|uniref:Uncharacterized protein n=1 Tax=Myceligenerans pegani TaxID=2776917 RepID=A0ABR9N038_9MICO|nr:hypothetical protein [Myceligenerans sp. TRM 65318]MBE1876382.1 hypothetical protein [Myceligenerans sp. TRM 65318]MBE3018653.1 hypothetical protein [Myceligenerans sp. TRM 65318]